MIFSVQASADIHPGFRVGGYFDEGAAFAGAELELPIGIDWRLVPNAEIVFVDNGTLATFNFDFQYNFHTDYPVRLWAGAGPAIIYANPDNPNVGSDTHLGVNLFFGVGFPLQHERFLPYIQPKIILSNNSEFALAFGLRF